LNNYRGTYPAKPVKMKKKHQYSKKYPQENTD